MSAWQPIETAPKDGTPVLVWDDSMGCYNRHPTWPGVDDRRYAIGYCRPDGSWGNRNAAVCAPTHWQPLPGAPPLSSLDPGPLDSPAYDRRGVDAWRMPADLRSPTPAHAWPSLPASELEDYAAHVVTAVEAMTWRIASGLLEGRARR